MPTWDVIIVGGGLAGCVVANQLHQKRPNLSVLLIEAGKDVSGNEEVLQSGTSMQTPQDWGYMSIPQAHLNNRSIYTPSGKALGGGTVINGGAWVRGHRFDYDLWADLVGDKRWSYEGQLPYMKKTEKFYNPSINPEQHGYEGPMVIEGREGFKLPMRKHLEESYEALGVERLPGLDTNTGNPLGYGDLQYNRRGGQRQIASEVFPLHGVTVLSSVMAEKVLIKKSPEGPLEAYGVQLAGGTEHHANTVILTAGAYRTPQLLMLSGIGPREALQQHGIDVILDQPHVGQNLHDHIIMPTAWKVKSKSALVNTEAGGSDRKIDFIATVPVPKEGLRAAIARDSGGAEPGPDHDMIRQERAAVLHSIQYTGPPGAAENDGSVVLVMTVQLIATSRGSVGISSARVEDPPLIDHKYLSTEQDRYVAREALRFDVRLVGSDATVVGRDILDGEAVAPEQKPLTAESTDEEIDERVRSVAGSCCHPAGSAAMGRVVNTDLSVKDVGGLFVTDTCVFPISVTANLQVALYALAMQAADIIATYTDGRKSS